MTARAEILARVRAALADSPAPPPVPGGYRRAQPPGPGRLTAGSAPLPPLAAGTEDRTELVALLADRLADYRAGVSRVGPDGLAETIAGLLGDAGTGGVSVVVPADLPPDWLTGYRGTVRLEPASAVSPAPAATPVSPVSPVSLAELDAPGVSVLTGCAVAVAETGTIVLDTGPAQGRRALTLVPDHHVCVVRAEQVVATVPEALARLPDPTRPLTFISGPSATSDIELDRVEGVHGPRRLDVIVVVSGERRRE